MRRHYSLVLALTIATTFVVTTAAPRAQAHQYVTNGGFEAGREGWADPHGASLIIVDESLVPPPDGEHSAMLVLQGGAFELRQTATGFGPGQYHLAAHVRVEAATIVRLNVRAITLAQSATDIEVDGVPGEWVTRNIDFTLPAFSDLALIIEGSGGANDRVFIDDISLDGDAPVTPTPTDAPPPADTQTATRTGTPTKTPTPSKTPTPTHTPRATQTQATDTPGGGAPPSDSPGPALRNGGFESVSEGAPNDWFHYGGSLSSVDSPVYDGANAASIESTTDSTKWIYQTVTIDPNASYAFSAWIFDDDPAVKSAFLRVSWYASEDGSGSALRSTDSLARIDAPASQYQVLTTGGVSAPLDARSARLRVMLAPVSASPAVIFVDDAEFLQADTPAGQPAKEASDPGAADGATGAGRGVLSFSQQLPSGVSSSRSDGGASRSSGHIVINEVLYDADVSGSDADAEWVELYNATDAPVRLDGWHISDAVSSDVIPPTTLGPRSFMVLAASDSFRDAYPDFSGTLVVLGSRIGNSLGNDGDALALTDGDDVVLDAISWGANSSVLNPPIRDVPAGHSIERASPGVDTDASADFVDNESPSPGRGIASVAVAQPQPQRGAVTSPQILAATGSSFQALIWVITGGASAALFGAIAWLAVPQLSRRLRHNP